MGSGFYDMVGDSDEGNLEDEYIWRGSIACCGSKQNRNKIARHLNLLQFHNNISKPPRCSDALAILDRPGARDPARVDSPAKLMFRECLLYLNMKAKLTNSKCLLWYHVPPVGRRTLLYHRQLPVPAEDAYLEVEDGEVPSRFPDLLERQNDCAVFSLYGIALRAEGLPFDVPHGMFLDQLSPSTWLLIAADILGHLHNPLGCIRCSHSLAMGRDPLPPRCRTYSGWIDRMP